MSETGRCRLCNEMSPLRISHLVPKFVSDWTKTEGKGLRNVANPNLAIQDGLKRPMLCSACEQRLGRWESQVAARIFVPLNREGVTQHRYGTWLLPFAVSVSFRILAHFRETGVGFDGAHRPFPDEFVAETDAALTSWKNLLLGQSQSVGSFEQHMFPLNDVPAATDLQRAVRGYIRIGIDAVAPWPAPDGGVFVIAKCADWFASERSGRVPVLGDARRFTQAEEHLGACSRWLNGYRIISTISRRFAAKPLDERLRDSAN